MGEESARLRAEIDQTREDLTRDVDLLAEKTSPSKIVERRVEKTKRGITGLKDKVMGALPGSDDEPQQQGGYGYGYGYGTQQTSGSSGGGIASNVSSAAGSARDSVQGAVSNATSTVSDAASSVSGAAHDAASSVSGAAHGAVGTVREQVGNVREQAEGNPFAAGVVAFGIGWLVSSLMPASQAEQRAARRAVEQAKNAPILDQAKSVVQDVGQNLQESATQAVQQVKEKAQDATSTVKDEAQGAAQDVKQSAGGAAQDVKEQTQQHVEAVRSSSGS